MWTKTAEDRLKELGMTKAQIEELSDNTNLGVNIITNVLFEAKNSELIEISADNY